MKQILLLLEFIIVCACVHRSNSFPVRFENGSEFKGRLEIQFHDDELGTVCDDGWDRNDTLVVCRQLEFESANNTDDESNYTIWYYSSSCDGTEAALEQCLNGTEWKGTHGQDPGVKCTSSNNGPTNNTQQFFCDIDFRLPSLEDGESMYSYLPATASLEFIRIVLHPHNTTVIPHYTHDISLWIIVPTIVGAIATVVIAIIGIVKCLWGKKQNPSINVNLGLTGPPQGEQLGTAQDNADGGQDVVAQPKVLRI